MKSKNNYVVDMQFLLHDEAQSEKFIDIGVEDLDKKKKNLHRSSPTTSFFFGNIQDAD